MILRPEHETEGLAKKKKSQFANDIEHVPMEPRPQIYHRTTRCRFVQSPYKEVTAPVDISLQCRNGGHAVYVIDDASTGAVQYLVGFADSYMNTSRKFCSTDRTEIGFGQRRSCSVCLPDNFWICASDFIRSDPNKRSVLLMESALYSVHVALGDAINHAQPGDRRPEGPGYVLQRM